jgi:hypothetical protein
MILSLQAILLSVFLIGISGPPDEVKIKVKDKLTQKDIPYSKLTVCGKEYVSDEFGEVTLSDKEDYCFVSIEKEGYKLLENNVTLKHKESLMFYLDENTHVLDEFVVSHNRLYLKDPKEILLAALVNFENNHVIEDLDFKLSESLTFQFGHSEILGRKTTANGKIENFNLVFQDEDSYAYQMVDLDPKRKKVVEDFIRQSGVSGQKKSEYGNKRSDKIEKVSCDPSKSLDCYMKSFYSFNRGFLFNPLINYKFESKPLDHFGFLNRGFLDHHKFKLAGRTKYKDRDCYVIQVMASKNSLPMSLFGNPSSLYKPQGTLMVDVESFAFLKVDYQYLMDKKSNFLTSQAIKNELASGRIYFENIISFVEVDGKWLVETQFVKEKDRVLKIFDSNNQFEVGYVDRHLTYSYF